MTDENVAGQPDSDSWSGRSNRTGLLAGGAVGLVLCAVVGATGGYLLAGDGAASNRQARSASTTTAAESPSGTPRATPSRTPSRRPSSSAPSAPIGQILLPNLVGKDFEEAREELGRRGLGAQFVFGSAGNDRTVASTNPRGDTSVKRGTTVRVTVVGAAPKVTVPELVGESCRQAARRLVDDGLFPRYPTGDNGHVRDQEPKQGTVLHWNDRVDLHCSDAAEPSASSTY